MKGPSHSFEWEGPQAISDL